MATFTLTTGDDTFSGSGAKDLFTGPGGGTDALDGNGGRDVFEIGGGSAGTAAGGGNFDRVIATGFDLGTMSFTGMEALNLSLGGITASATQLGSFARLYSSDGGTDIQIELVGSGGAIDFGTQWHGHKTLHVDGFNATGPDGVTLTGTRRGDFMGGTNFTDVISGGGGRDQLDTRDGSNDTLNGDDGADILSSFAVTPTLNGGNGKDDIFCYALGFLNGDAGINSLSTQLGGNTLNGGLGGDHILLGLGTVTLVYGAVSESTGVDNHDVIKRIDFTQTTFDTPSAVTGTDAAITSGALSEATFDANLAVAVNASNLAANHAVLLTADSGDLAGHTYLVIDQDGVAGYLVGNDLVMELRNSQDLALDSATFI